MEHLKKYWWAYAIGIIAIIFIIPMIFQKKGPKKPANLTAQESKIWDKIVNCQAEYDPNDTIEQSLSKCGVTSDEMSTAKNLFLGILENAVWGRRK